MSLGVSVVDFQGVDKDGFLKLKSHEYDFNNSIRAFHDEVDQMYIDSGIYGDWTAIHRPTNFSDAYKWAEENDRKDISGLLDVLRANKDLYLEYHY